MPWVDEFSHGHPCPISYSKLKVACEGTWAEYRWALDHPTPMGSAGQFSRLFHQVLFNQQQEEPIPEAEFNHRSPAGREEFRAWGASLPRGALVKAVAHDAQWLIERLDRADLTIIDGDSYDRARRMADSVRARAFWRENFPLGVAERKGEVEVEGSLLRFIPDLLIRDKGLIVDAKGVKDVSPKGLVDAIFNYLWDIQASLYLKGASLIEGIKFDRFVICAVLNVEPYIAVEREIPADVLMFAWDVAIAKLRQLRACVEFDHWPGYDETVKTIDWKPWMVAQREAMIDG